VGEILGPNGQPFLFKKAPEPKLGPSYGIWEGRDSLYPLLPGGSVLQFDLSKLTLADYRAMRHHSQVNASLSSLTFMMHQIDWHIECKDKKIADKVEANLRDVWTRLVRGMSQAFWAGYSPMALEFQNSNDDDELDIVLKRVKDLVPEDCRPHWKEVEGARPKSPVMLPGTPNGTGIKPKLKIYDGIDQHGYGWIPVENTLWFPLLMEQGDYFGRKLLNAAFTPWYFSTLIHLFANRYYERFGEPTPVGRAPYDEEINLADGSTINGKEVMDRILTNLRNRASVNLPSDRDPVTKEFDYTLEYLETQMRGADFERYLTRLDEEISLAMFTPLLLLKSGDVGSNNLGVQHTQTYLWFLNAISGDMSEYLTILTERLKAINFSPNAPTCKWVPKKMGKDNAETLRALVVELIRGNKAKIDLEALGESVGMTLTEVRTVLAPDDGQQPTDPAAGTGAADPGAPRDERVRTERVRARSSARGVDESRATARAIGHRVKAQVVKAFQDGTFGSTFKVDLGYQRRFQSALEADGLPTDEATEVKNQFYTKMQAWVDYTQNLGPQEFASAADYMALFDRRMDSLIEEIHATD
jgi:hypothetical protein